MYFVQTCAYRLLVLAANALSKRLLAPKRGVLLVEVAAPGSRRDHDGGVGLPILGEAKPIGGGGGGATVVPTHVAARPSAVERAQSDAWCNSAAPDKED